MPYGPARDVEVFGVVSRGSKECGQHATHPGIYTSFQRHASFLREALAADAPLAGDPPDADATAEAPARRAPRILAMVLPAM